MKPMIELKNGVLLADLMRIFRPPSISVWHIAMYDQAPMPGSSPRLKTPRRFLFPAAHPTGAEPQGESRCVAKTARFGGRAKALILLLVLSGAVHAADLDRLIPALIQVESNGRTHAVGDGGLAAGCLQIHTCVIADVNRIYKMNYSAADRFDRVKSIDICRAYLGHYAAGKSNEQAARIWNGGPRGHLKPATEGYWKKVERAMKCTKMQSDG